MSFNVTQCPACESTFNTNSRVLAAAAGRVRCGACLNVFEAIDNFLIPEEGDTAQNQDESVFVGNDPQEFFDPASFLTRSALSETQSDKPTRDDPIDEQNLDQELEQSKAVSADFISTVTGELQERAEAPALKNSHEDEEPQIDQPESLQASIANESIDDEFKEEILDFFAAETTDDHELSKYDPADSSFDELIESEPEFTVATETHTESEESYIVMSLSASFIFNPNSIPEVRIGEPKPVASKDKETTSEQEIAPSVAGDAEAEFSTDSEEPLLDIQAETSVQDVHVPSDSERSQLNDEVTLPSSNDEPTQALAEEDRATTESLLAKESSAAAEPAADPTAYIEGLSVDSASPSDETDEIHAPAEQEELTSEGVAEDEEPTIAAVQTSTQEVDEESTEAIRARALEAELSDEEALEAIPQENLAALGSMSTPVELLARKESRILRSTLLYLSILLLGGLLSSQYLWQRRDLYSQLPQLRPLYEVACNYLNCALPEYADIGSIRSENLTVQTHPTFANGLMINTVIRNTAEFEQPFPILILSFNSARNSVIALREFTSSEYLDPGLRSIRVMPAKTPVQIGLAIMDPGPDAVNYTLAFRWP